MFTYTITLGNIFRIRIYNAFIIGLKVKHMYHII